MSVHFRLGALLYGANLELVNHCTPIVTCAKVYCTPVAASSVPFHVLYANCAKCAARLAPILATCTHAFLQGCLILCVGWITGSVRPRPTCPLRLLPTHHFRPLPTCHLGSLPICHLSRVTAYYIYLHTVEYGQAT